MKRSVCFSLLLVLSLVVYTGCGGQKIPDGMPEPVKFTLTIHQAGAPLEGAEVRLQCPEIPYSVDGLTDDKGIVKLMTVGQYPGAPVGEYKVAVTKKIATESKYGNIIPTSDAGAAKWMADRKAEYRPTHSYVEKKYGDFATSGLTVSIVAGGNGSLDVGAPVDDIEIPEDSAPAPGSAPAAEPAAAAEPAPAAAE